MHDSWEIRFEWIQTILQWLTLAFGIGLTLMQLGVDASTVAASLAVVGYTVAMQFIPLRRQTSTLIGGLLALLGVVTSLFAVALTGGIDSAFVLYLAVPVFFASAFHGMVLGGLTTFAAIFGLAGVAATSNVALLSTPLPLMVVFYALIGITFSQAHRILIDEPSQESGAVRFRRLESAHHLLADLADLASEAELNPIAIGRAALRDLAVHVPYSSGSIAIIDDGEEIAVATRGQPRSADEATVYPVLKQQDRVGSLYLWAMEGESFDPYVIEINRGMQAVAFAFANVLLLQSIAHRAVREERVRLARELHDDIGPSLVSVGLGIDLTLQTGEIDGVSRQHLETMRETVSDLVEEVRDTVTHLRSDDLTSLLEHARALAADVAADGPSITIDIDEVQLPRPRDASELSAIMTEAVRNAVEHAEASMIRVEGFVYGDSGEFCVCDNGRGMDPHLAVAQRYGVVGMQERADIIGAQLSIESDTVLGTKVTVRWNRHE